MNCCQNSKVGAVSHQPEYPAPRQLCDAGVGDPQGAAAGRVGWCEVCRLDQKRWEWHPWAQRHAPPILLGGTFPHSRFLMESWLLAEQGFHGLALPPRPAPWPGWFVASQWVVKLCGGPSLWNFGREGACVIESSSGSSPCGEVGPQMDKFRS